MPSTVFCSQRGAMTKTVRTRLPDGSEILVEAIGADQLVDAGGGKISERAVGAFKEGLELIASLARSVRHSIAELKSEDAPNKVELEFGIKIDAELGAMIARASTDAQLRILIAWETMK